MSNRDIQKRKQRTSKKNAENNDARQKAPAETSVRARESEPKLAPGLYVVATPIGNLMDMTYRAVSTLQAVDLILCEDTRQTAKLCANFNIATARRAYHDHNAVSVRPEIIERLQDGAAIALVSDAGTPLISDPGFKLVSEARAASVAVVPIPGASSVLAALSAAGAPTDQFFFAGFAPQKPGARSRFYKALSETSATAVVFETPPRLAASLRALAGHAPDRRVTVARELTKRFEEFVAGTPEELANRFEAEPTLGEIVLVIGPPSEAREMPSEETLRRFLVDALSTLSVKDAASAAAQALGVPRKQAYALAQSIKNERTET
ncbi:MAG: 16S rRNA (cytidine(1402)-2'-O)-methyltransferase [Pseudomonadota bacterium]